MINSRGECRCSAAIYGSSPEDDDDGCGRYGMTVTVSWKLAGTKS